jgi:hypothetical protein
MFRMCYFNRSIRRSLTIVVNGPWVQIGNVVNCYQIITKQTSLQVLRFGFLNLKYEKFRSEGRYFWVHYVSFADRIFETGE